MSDLKTIARNEWEENLALDRIVVPHGWDTDLWLDYLAARTVYIHGKSCPDLTSQETVEKIARVSCVRCRCERCLREGNGIVTKHDRENVEAVLRAVKGDTE